jgi:hypothetical protein
MDIAADIIAVMVFVAAFGVGWCSYKLFFA